MFLVRITLFLNEFLKVIEYYQLCFFPRHLHYQNKYGGRRSTRILQLRVNFDCFRPFKVKLYSFYAF